MKNYEEHLSEPERIVEETQREAILNRPHNLGGSVNLVNKTRFNITPTEITHSDSKSVPALLKIFMEALDNPIDIAIKGGCKTIDVKVDEKSITVKDDGYGVDTREVDGESIVYKAFCKYNTSSNYGDNRGKFAQKGVNGIGIKLTATLSKTFIVESEDKYGRVKLTVTENNLHHDLKEYKPKGKTGVNVYFEPDFSIFDVDSIDETHINRMYEYILMQSLTYPDVSFKFNGKKVSLKPKQFVKMLSEDAVIEEYDDYFIGVVPNESGEFLHLTYMNGLEVSDGGSVTDYISNKVTQVLRDKFIKKYKTIKPQDVKRKLTVIIVGKGMGVINWDSQMKSKITNPMQDIVKYFKDLLL